MANIEAKTAKIGYIVEPSCFVRLPADLIRQIDNKTAQPENVIIELRIPATNDSISRSIYVGWTGPHEYAPDGYVEIDSKFARALKLPKGQDITVITHLQFEVVRSLIVQPETADDWEMIEANATSLEEAIPLQVRAVPNPMFAGSKTTQGNPHPMTIRLSAKTDNSVNIVASSFIPAVSPDVPFVKLPRGAEVAVIPMKRNHPDPKDNHSVTSGSQKSGGTRSGTGSSKARASKPGVKQTIYLRALSTSLLLQPSLQALDPTCLSSPTIWVEESIVREKFPKWPEWVLVSRVASFGSHTTNTSDEPQGSQAQEGTDTSKHVTRIAARLQKHARTPEPEHALLSVPLASAIGLKSRVGDVVHIEPAPPTTSRSLVKSLKIYPFRMETAPIDKNLKSEDALRRRKEVLTDDIKKQHGAMDGSTGLLGGPLTDGMIIRAKSGIQQLWTGGLLSFEPRLSQTNGKLQSTRWLIDPKQQLPIRIGEEIQDPLPTNRSSKPGTEVLPEPLNVLIGLQKISDQVVSSLVHQSSVLLEGGMGAGKTSIAAIVGRRLEAEHLVHVAYLDCRKLTTDETRVATIKELLKSKLMEARWCSQFRGRSVVVFDDLDKLCPAETELQVGGENARSRQLAEIFSSLVHQYCTGASGISILATAIGKESLQAMLIGSHVVRDIISIKAPDKIRRRDMLQTLIRHQEETPDGMLGAASNDRHSLHYADATADLDGRSDEGDDEAATVFNIDPDVDLLDIAGRTDGYMPGDLVLLASRTRSEVIMRSIREDALEQRMVITKDDFDRALKGFIPVSLRNVALQSSSTTFDSIGGLEKTRQILLETLQYPTTYAPIFAQCPLRLRSGLLLYGYPGCGKTLLASAVAGECGLNFISVKGPEILNKYIGASEKSVRDLFERAESAKPCVLFFDEFDSIAPKRGHDSTGVTDRVVNQLLTQMDGAEGLTGVYVLAATSRPDMIDPALLRPGRLDKSLLCDMPDETDRLGILMALSKPLKMNPSVRSPSQPSNKSLAEVARRTEGYSGADLQAIVYNAQLEAVHELLADHRPEPSNKAVASKSRHVPQQDLLAFRFGEHGKEPNGTAGSLDQTYRPAQLGEREVLAAQLDALKQAKRKEKAFRRGQVGNEQGRSDQKAEGPEPIIQWKHIEASLNTTRRSINDAERTKLERIYREFLVGRNGEMPSGQGSNEVGARSSLM